MNSRHNMLAAIPCSRVFSQLRHQKVRMPRLAAEP